MARLESTVGRDDGVHDVLEHDVSPVLAREGEDDRADVVRGLLVDGDDVGDAHGRPAAWTALIAATAPLDDARSMEEVAACAQLGAVPARHGIHADGAAVLAALEHVVVDVAHAHVVELGLGSSRAQRAALAHAHAIV